VAWADFFAGVVGDGFFFGWEFSVAGFSGPFLALEAVVSG